MAVIKTSGEWWYSLSIGIENPKEMAKDKETVGTCGRSGCVIYM